MGENAQGLDPREYFQGIRNFKNLIYSTDAKKDPFLCFLKIYKINKILY